MTISVTAKSRTISNGDSGDAVPVEANFTDLYNNDSTLATAHNLVLATTSTNSAVDGLYLILRNSYASAPGSTDHGGLELERGSSTNVRIRWNETNDWWELTNDGTNYHPVSLVSSSDPASPVEGDIWYNTTSHALKYRANGSTVTIPTTSGASAFDDLSDVTITAAASGDYLRYNGTAWVNARPYESSGQTITSAGSLTLAHSLGATPKRIAAYIKCTSGEANYSVGDEYPIPIGITMRGTTQAIGFSVVVDATNIKVRFADDTKPIFINDKTTGTSFNCTNASWQLYIRAWLV